jgi:menaquinone-specific isochorismate synthase
MATDDRDPESANAGGVTESRERFAPIATRHAETAPVSVHQAVEALDSVTAVWDSPGEFPVIALGREAAVTGSGPGRFEAVRAAGTELLETVETDGVPDVARPRLFGGFSFFDATELGPPWTGFEPAEFLLPSVQLTLAPDRTLLTGFGSGASADQLAETVATLKDAAETGSEVTAGVGVAAGSGALRAERTGWIERVEAIRGQIADSNLEKAVLAVAFDVALQRAVPLGAVLAALESRYPDCYRFSFSAGEATFFGATPERLVGKRGLTVETEALAGTVGRGESDSEDAAQVDHLLSNETIGQEHAVVAEEIAEQLRAVGADVSVADRGVLSLANVHHLRTPISATLSAEAHVLDLVERLHPTPAVGGFPPTAARAAIRGTESIVRGWYGAPIGWFDAAGDGTFAVGIRSALAREGTATLFAGNGIVAGSDPETEWAELEAKFQPIREVLS